MEINDVISTIIGIAGIGGMVFTIYHSVKNPQIKIEKDQIKSEEELKDKATILSQKEVESKAQLLAQQVQWEKEANEKRFCEMSLNMKEAMTLAQNHIHSISVQVEGLSASISLMNLNIMKLQTILDERLSKK